MLLFSGAILLIPEAWLILVFLGSGLRSVSYFHSMFLILYLIIAAYHSFRFNCSLGPVLLLGCSGCRRQLVCSSPISRNDVGKVASVETNPWWVQLLGRYY
jgi:hypothetical protein